MSHDPDMAWHGSAGEARRGPAGFGQAGHGTAGIDSGPRLGASDTRALSGGVVAARGSDSLPTLGMIVRDLERLGQQFVNIAGRQWDPISVSGDEAWPGMLLADLKLASAVSNVRQALHDLAELAALTHPPAGSAVPVMFPDRPAFTAPGRPTPGSAAADPDIAVGESSDGLASVRAGANVHDPACPEWCCS